MAFGAALPACRDKFQDGSTSLNLLFRRHMENFRSGARAMNACPFKRNDVTADTR